jgi:hypothetical protein
MLFECDGLVSIVGMGMLRDGFDLMIKIVVVVGAVVVVVVKAVHLYHLVVVVVDVVVDDG